MVFEACVGLWPCCCTQGEAGSSSEASCPICLPAALPAVAAHKGSVGGRQNRSDAEAQVWWDSELPAAGMGDVPPMQLWTADFWSCGCELWSPGSSSPLPQHLVVSEQQFKIYFSSRQIALQWDANYFCRHLAWSWTVLVLFGHQDSAVTT